MEQIKLVIWDLDDTFWQGTLSEGAVAPIDEKIALIKTLTDRGIVNSICSKNDYDKTKAELEKLSVWDLFVFPSIDWTNKGVRIKKIIDDMQLRAVNVLFVDDNINNLKEAEFECQGLQTCLPDELAELVQTPAFSGKDDSTRSRLKQYKILEEKAVVQATSSNDEFLYQSGIKCELVRDWTNEINRAHELINRTNQLNFTKDRLSKEETAELLKIANDSGLVRVCDKYGDHGFVGFFAVKDGKCLQLCFSCRIMGMGIEQYVYASLGWPSINVVGETATVLTKEPPPNHINQGVGSHIEEASKVKGSRILFKGPCNIEAIMPYIGSQHKIDAELTYWENRHLIQNQNHTVSILGSMKYTDAQKAELISHVPSYDNNFFNTKIFTEKYDVIVLSVLIDYSKALYQSIRDPEVYAVFGEFTTNIDDEDSRKYYIENERYDDEEFDSFREHYKYVGIIPKEWFIRNLTEIVESVSPKTIFMFINGSEKPFIEKFFNDYERVRKDRHIIHKEYNECLRKFCSDKDNCFIIDVNNFIDEKDYYDSINHFSRFASYNLAKEIVAIINQRSGSSDLKVRSFAYLLICYLNDGVRALKGQLAKHKRIYRVLKTLKDSLKK